MPPLVICNPQAGSGRAARRWPALLTALRGLLGPLDTVLATCAAETAAAAGAATRSGRALVLVGGDGTLNAAVGGIGPALDEGAPVPSLALVNAGSGGDFCRTLGLPPGDLASARALANGQLLPIDLGRIDLTGAQGQPVTRWFLSVANAGLSAGIVQSMQGSPLPALLGPKLAYVPYALRQLLRERGFDLVLRTATGKEIRSTLLLVSVANGRHFAAGMCIAPQARPDDGLFDVMLIREDRRIRPWDLRLLYSGRILDHPAASLLRTASLEIRAADGSALPLDADGELMGVLPARLTCQPGALRVALPRLPPA
ncbi:diacylglycerol/lipid kinase family protein [Neotabrizicola shimadae]|uniref:DAGKc domain-containing protein n=1 Tax=Neotabrizicola shimadae TaxID=2807096 RepID=A0A8G0ZMP1_9RHOB|nr:diacylglycerol kinase family protein [Neotabrizicola shimadae]QYZ68161.1 hypothetical protein JO391_10135 [Neotabrizicola shimadae]